MQCVETPLLSRGGVTVGGVACAEPCGTVPLHAHGRFGGSQCLWCDRVIVPAMDDSHIITENQTPCALCEKGNFQYVFDKSIALWTLKRFLRVKLSEDLGDAVTVAVLISLCGSFSITMVPLARIHHVYCTLLQKNSPFLELLLDNCDVAEPDEAIQLACMMSPLVSIDLIFDFIYFGTRSDSVFENTSDVKVRVSNTADTRVNLCYTE